MPKTKAKGPGLKQLNKELRRLRALKAKATTPKLEDEYEKKIIQVVSDKNKAKKGYGRVKKQTLRDRRLLGLAK